MPGRGTTMHPTMMAEPFENSDLRKIHPSCRSVQRLEPVVELG